MSGSDAGPAGIAAASAAVEVGEAGGLFDLYRTMLLIRLAEERAAEAFAAGEVPGFIHLSVGQEAVAAGVAAALGPADTMVSTHRGHGHALARGMGLEPFFAELLGRAGGACGGRGGSMHVADLAAGMLGANGIVGAGIALAAGSALAHQLAGGNAVAAAFVGDGALAEGLTHETLNIAALWRLPLLVVCEANGWAEFTPSAQQLAFRLEDLAAAYGLAHRAVDGADAEEVAAAAGEAVAELRAGRGPRVLECRTARFRGHFEGDAQRYRRDPPDPAQDPLPRARARLEARGADPAGLDRLAAALRERVEAALAAARVQLPPDFTRALAGVYARPSST